MHDVREWARDLYLSSTVQEISINDCLIWPRRFANLCSVHVWGSRCGLLIAIVFKQLEISMMGDLTNLEEEPEFGGFLLKLLKVAFYFHSIICVIPKIIKCSP